MNKISDELVKHYVASGQLRYDLGYLGLSDTEDKLTLLEAIIQAHTNHVVAEVIKIVGIEVAAKMNIATGGLITHVGKDRPIPEMLTPTPFFISPRKIAIVLGGGERVWEDIDRAVAFCNAHNLVPEWFAVNDMIAQFSGPITAVTLHPDKLHQWLPQRRNALHPMPSQVWCHNGGDSAQNPNSLVTHRLKDWGGSAGMFGYAVARERGHDRVILCGVPMNLDNHFVRKAKWIAVSAFTRAWETNREKMLPHCRSMSGGWTGVLFGEPDAAWLETKMEDAA